MEKSKFLEALQWLLSLEYSLVTKSVFIGHQVKIFINYMVFLFSKLTKSKALVAVSDIK